MPEINANLDVSADRDSRDPIEGLKIPSDSHKKHQIPLSAAWKRVPLAYNNLEEAELTAAEAVLRSGNLTQGEVVEKFESAFAEYLGSKYAILVNSGSSANLIAIEAVYYCSRRWPEMTHGMLKPGDEVIVSGLCWPTTLTPLLNHGLQPVFCDVNLQSLNITVENLEAVRTARTRAVIGIPVLGNPENLEDLRSYCKRERLILIEDACESLGAVSAAGEKIGTFGTASAFSFYFSHHISTIEGGAVATNSKEIADLCYALRSHGWTRHLKLGTIPFDYFTADGIDPLFCFFVPGYNVRATEIAAALGCVQLAKLPLMLDRRRSIAAGRIQALRWVWDSLHIPGADIWERHSWMTFPLLFSDANHKKRGKAILESRGIETRPIIVGNILRHPLARYLHLKHDQPELPHCDAVFERGLMIGLNPFSDPETEAHVQRALCEAAQA